MSNGGSRHVGAIAGRLSLRKPQRESLEILHRVTQLAPPKKGADAVAALEAIRREFPNVTDFERDFPSLCFALATGVGKTRLMGAFIAYLYAEHGLNNFFVLAPNLTIYNKLIADFTPNTPKYVFRGLAEFAIEQPHIVTGDSYEQASAMPLGSWSRCSINIFNISKINSEVRGGKAPRIRRLSEYIGQSYFDYLAGLPDLVLLMDESHRYRASAGVRAINELKPVLGLELTATPFDSSTIPRSKNSPQPPRFKNVIYDYALGRAMEDGFVKEPAVATRKDFDASAMSPEQLERLKLEDGVRLHEATKVELDTYSRQAGVERVKPFMLVIARDTTHAAQLVTQMESEAFFGGSYKGKVIQVDSSKSGADEEEMIARLLKVEQADEPTEIVVHVNMLKEGWDVTNLYTIVPLRAANARVLVEQSIGRGLRLPYGKRTGVEAVDTLSIVAHDKFQEIVDEAKKPDSMIRLKTIVLDPAQLEQRTTTVVSASKLDVMLGVAKAMGGDGSATVSPAAPPLFSTPGEQQFAKQVDAVIRDLARRPEFVPTVEALALPAVQAEIVKEAQRRQATTQLTLDGMDDGPDPVAVAAKVAEQWVKQTISIPRISVLPKSERRWGFHSFQLDLSALKYPPVSEDLWVQYLRTGEAKLVAVGSGGVAAKRLEDYVVRGLMDLNDVDYDRHAELLYDLAGQVVRHLRQTLDEAECEKVLRCYQRQIVELVHAQMQPHYWEDPVEYEVVVGQAFGDLKPSAYTTAANQPALDFRSPPPDKVHISRYLFSGFRRGLYDLEKFQSDPERQLAEILDRDAAKWFRPRQGQFQLYYRDGADQHEYQPDFVAESTSEVYMLEPKAANQLDNPIVQAKRAVAERWCQHASDYATKHGAKPWRYVLIPHDAIKGNMSLEWLVGRYGR